MTHHFLNFTSSLIRNQASAQLLQSGYIDRWMHAPSRRVYCTALLVHEQIKCGELMEATTEQHDIIIIGAGLSGINTAHILRENLPNRRFIILEGRAVLGGTWNFFRYPGFRSDSPLTTFGFKWYPWKHKHLIAKGYELVEYMTEAAAADGSLKHIRFRHLVKNCEWRSEEQQWRLYVDANGTPKVFRANFILTCMGYYSYSKALDTVIPGIENFGGKVVHPQWWPEDLDYSGKRIVVIGSGATAITIVPTLAKSAGHVTQLQRSPSYVARRPNSSKFRDILRIFLPLLWVHWICWWKDTLLELFFSEFFLKFPRAGKAILNFGMSLELPAHINRNIHFSPRYNPFEQRLCLCPDGDFFKSLGQGNCDIVTDVIETVTSDGIQLKSGDKLPADIIVTATGLYFETFGGLKPKVDGKEIEPGSYYAWRGCMLETVPNMAFIMGNVTQSWTPVASVMSKIAIRVIQLMEQKGSTSATPILQRWEGMPRKLAIDASSNYFTKAADRIPKVTGETPWYGRKNLFVDLWPLLFGNLEDGLVFAAVDKKHT
ncbi:hypothetical protein B0O99DRAFT_645294 [Bisporella sp. PMI_857]|nr:hypothetical protein B0O99DRAFT_645294 [Bisporella sp. PMI_857]